MKLLWNDLIQVPHPEGRKEAVYWLRLYRGDERNLAVLTHVPGSPWESYVTMSDDIPRFLRDHFEVEAEGLRIYEVHPLGDPDRDGTGWERVIIGSEPKWLSSNREEVEEIVGGAIPLLPTHDELYARVCQLGGGNWDSPGRVIREAIPVAEFPPPHNPHRCAHYSSFQEISTRLARKTGDTFQTQLDAGQLFLKALGPAQFRKCRYHQADWRSVADASVAILEIVGPEATEDEYEAAVEAAGLGYAETRWLGSLFRDPIAIAEGRDYSNGQHRGCALRFSGAERAVVVTDIEAMPEVNVDWTYEGDG